MSCNKIDGIKLTNKEMTNTMSDYLHFVVILNDIFGKDVTNIILHFHQDKKKKLITNLILSGYNVVDFVYDWRYAGNYQDDINGDYFFKQTGIVRPHNESLKINDELKYRCKCNKIINSVFFIYNTKNTKEYMWVGSGCIKNFLIHGKFKNCLNCKGRFKSSVKKNIKRKRYNYCKKCEKRKCIIVGCDGFSSENNKSDRCDNCIEKLCKTCDDFKHEYKQKYYPYKTKIYPYCQPCLEQIKQMKQMKQMKKCPKCPKMIESNYPTCYNCRFS